MKNILLLYDTQEEDLARDFKDLLAELDVKVSMIALSPNKGNTLYDKEEHHFNSADGAIFIITPGSERMGKRYPSPSVTDEMGQAKRTFKNNPEKIIYLIDKDCTLQAIDQKPYTSFDRNSIRSVVKAITMFIKDLKLADWFGKNKIEQKEIPVIDIAKYSESINKPLKKICFDLSDVKDGLMNFTDFDNLLKTKYKMSQREINFTKRDLGSSGKKLIHELPLVGWKLSDIGFELVRYEDEQKKRQISTHHYGLLDNSPTPMSLLERSLLGGIKKV